MSILSTFYCTDVVTVLKHKLSESGNYFIPPKGKMWQLKQNPSSKLV